MTFPMAAHAVRYVLYLTESFHVPEAVVFFFALPVISAAGTTVYTDSAHLPVNPPPDVQVVLLDGHSNCRMLFRPVAD